MRRIRKHRPFTLEPLAAMLTAVGLFGAAMSDQLSFVACIFLLALALPGFVLSNWPQAPAYRRAWNAAALLVVLAAAMDFFLADRSIALHLLAVCGILLLRTVYLPRRQRDYMTIWAISTALLTIGAARASSPLIVPFVLVWSLLTMTMLARMAQRRSMELVGSSKPSKPTAEPPRIARYIPVLAILTTMVFFLLPRPGHMQAAWLSGEAIQKNRARLLRSGLSDSVELTTMTRLKEEPGIALRVQTDRPSLRLSSLKFRLGTLGGFTGDHWFRMEAPGSPGPERLSREVGEPAFVLYHSNDAALPASEELTIMLVDFPTEVLPVPEGTLGLRVPAPALLLEPDGRLALPPETPPPFSFSPRVALDPAIRPLASRGDVRDIHLAIPAALDRQEIERLASEIVGSEETPEGQARAIWNWFRRNGVYTTDLRHLKSGPDGVMEFLHRPQGHCELFATGMALLARARGIPSRLVVGYSPGQTAPGSSEVIVRHADAHAWTEVYLPGTGWTAFDPTPSAPLAPASDRLLFNRLRDTASVASARFGRLMEGYDRSKQQSLMSGMLQGLGKWASGYENGLLTRTFQRIRENAKRQEVIVAFVALTLLNLGFWLVGGRLRRRLSRWEKRRHERHRRAIPRLLRDLARALGAGHEIDHLASSQTARDLIASLATERGLNSAETGELIGLYSQWRYGGQAQPEAQLRARIRALKSRKRRAG
ncbi:DUF3488 domain-containing protein [bacterium]|nr:DUF3488 domain-containing protein [bacterium]